MISCVMEAFMAVGSLHTRKNAAPGGSLGNNGRSPRISCLGEAMDQRAPAARHLAPADSTGEVPCVDRLPASGTDRAVAAPDLRALVVQHHADLYRYSFRLTGSPADAEDLVQQTFLRAQTRLEQLRDVQCARSWLFTILRNTFLKELQSRHRAVPVDPEMLDQVVDELPAHSAEDAIDREQLQAALSRLPDEFRVVLLMFYFEGLSYREIAEQLGIPCGTVMSRLSRAKQHLRRRLFAAAASASYLPPGSGNCRGAAESPAAERQPPRCEYPVSPSERAAPPLPRRRRPSSAQRHGSRPS
jgi:RNA polymerase sigma-70 factor (ECF subfamily)